MTALLFAMSAQAADDPGSSDPSSGAADSASVATADTAVSTDGDAGAAADPAPEATVEPAPEATVEPAPEATVDPAPEATVEPASEAGSSADPLEPALSAAAPAEESADTGGSGEMTTTSGTILDPEAATTEPVFVVDVEPESTTTDPAGEEAVIGTDAEPVLDTSVEPVFELDTTADSTAPETVLEPLSAQVTDPAADASATPTPGAIVEGPSDPISGTNNEIGTTGTGSDIPTVAPSVSTPSGSTPTHAAPKEPKGSTGGNSHPVSTPSIAPVAPAEVPPIASEPDAQPTPTGPVGAGAPGPAGNSAHDSSQLPAGSLAALDVEVLPLVGASWVMSASPAVGETNAGIGRTNGASTGSSDNRDAGRPAPAGDVSVPVPAPTPAAASGGASAGAAPGGGASGFAAVLCLLAFGSALCMGRRLRLATAVWRPVAFSSPLERPG